MIELKPSSKLRFAILHFGNISAEIVTYSSYKLDPKAYGLHGPQHQPYLSVPGRCTGDFFVQCDQTPDRENLRGEGCS